MTKRELSFFICFLGSFFLFESSAFPQEFPHGPPSKEELAKNNKLFIELATRALHGDERTERSKCVARHRRISLSSEDLQYAVRRRSDGWRRPVDGRPEARDIRIDGRKR
jgi:hypothetical protein